MDLALPEGHGDDPHSSLLHGFEEVGQVPDFLRIGVDTVWVLVTICHKHDDAARAFYRRRQRLKWPDFCHTVCNGQPDARTDCNGPTAFRQFVTVGLLLRQSVTAGLLITLPLSLDVL